MHWIKEFVDNAFPLNSKDVDLESAFTLKDINIPSSLFKYRDVNESSVKNLTDSTIWLADPKDFNDPYDCTHTIDAKKIFESRFAPTIEKLVNGSKSDMSLTPDQIDRLRKVTGSYENIIDIILEGENESSKESFRDTSFKLQSKLYDKLTGESSDMLSRSFKLCCFSAKNDSMLMWSHYANYHKGFCIEYDFDVYTKDDYRRRFVYPVIYTNRLFDATEHYVNGASEYSNNLHLTLAALIKSDVWRYEKEWRLIFAHNMCPERCAYPMVKTKAVYFGANISQSDKDVLIEICSNKKIKMYQMKIHKCEFKLIPDEL